MTFGYFSSRAETSRIDTGLSVPVSRGDGTRQAWPIFTRSPASLDSEPVVHHVCSGTVMRRSRPHGPIMDPQSPCLAFTVRSDIRVGGDDMWAEEHHRFTASPSQVDPPLLPVIPLNRLLFLQPL